MEIPYSFGHFGWSALREKRTAENCAMMSVKLQLASERGFGFGKKMKASIFGTKIQDVFTHDLRWFHMYLVIHHEHAGDLA